MKDHLPAVVSNNNRIIVKDFDPIDQSNFEWYQYDRTITITLVTGSGWFLQTGDKLPDQLFSGDAHTVIAHIKHRIIALKNATKATFKIQLQDNT